MVDCEMWYNYFFTKGYKSTKLKSLLNETLTHYKVHYSFLSDSQILGKTYTRLGIPHFCGKVNKYQLRLQTKQRVDNERSKLNIVFKQVGNTNKNCPQSKNKFPKGERTSKRIQEEETRELSGINTILEDWILSEGVDTNHNEEQKSIVRRLESKKKHLRVTFGVTKFINNSLDNTSMDDSRKLEDVVQPTPDQSSMQTSRHHSEASFSDQTSDTDSSVDTCWDTGLLSEESETDDHIVAATNNISLGANVADEDSIFSSTCIEDMETQEFAITVQKDVQTQNHSTANFRVPDEEANDDIFVCDKSYESVPDFRECDFTDNGTEVQAAIDCGETGQNVLDSEDAGQNKIFPALGTKTVPSYSEFFEDQSSFGLSNSVVERFLNGSTSVMQMVKNNSLNAVECLVDIETDKEIVKIDSNEKQFPVCRTQNDLNDLSSPPILYEDDVGLECSVSTTEMQNEAQTISTRTSVAECCNEILSSAEKFDDVMCSTDDEQDNDKLMQRTIEAVDLKGADSPTNHFEEVYSVKSDNSKFRESDFLMEETTPRKVTTFEGPDINNNEGNVPDYAEINDKDLYVQTTPSLKTHTEEEKENFNSSPIIIESSDDETQSTRRPMRLISNLRKKWLTNIPKQTQRLEKNSESFFKSSEFHHEPTSFSLPLHIESINSFNALASTDKLSFLRHSFNETLLSGWRKNKFGLLSLLRDKGHEVKGSESRENKPLDSSLKSDYFTETLNKTKSECIILDSSLEDNLKESHNVASFSDSLENILENAFYEESNNASDAVGSIESSLSCLSIAKGEGPLSKKESVRLSEEVEDKRVRESNGAGEISNLSHTGPTSPENHPGISLRQTCGEDEPPNRVRRRLVDTVEAPYSVPVEENLERPLDETVFVPEPRVSDLKTSWQNFKMPEGQYEEKRANSKESESNSLIPVSPLIANNRFDKKTRPSDDTNFPGLAANGESPTESHLSRFSGAQIGGKETGNAIFEKDGAESVVDSVEKSTFSEKIVENEFNIKYKNEKIKQTITGRSRCKGSGPQMKLFEKSFQRLDDSKSSSIISPSSQEFPKGNVRLSLDMKRLSKNSDIEQIRNSLVGRYSSPKGRATNTAPSLDKDGLVNVSFHRSNEGSKESFIKRPLFSDFTKKTLNIFSEDEVGKGRYHSKTVNETPVSELASDKTLSKSPGVPPGQDSKDESSRSSVIKSSYPVKLPTLVDLSPMKRAEKKRHASDLVLIRQGDEQHSKVKIPKMMARHDVSECLGNSQGNSASSQVVDEDLQKKFEEFLSGSLNSLEEGSDVTPSQTDNSLEENYIDDETLILKRRAFFI